ncbi:MAG: stage IV sporulation protein A [Lachnospiraceae bacterium]|nr:stage IV sporulation protein A [Lachnospiraceae bacterium]
MDTIKNNENKEFNLYKDIQIRTGGEIYLGIVGPVRTGKSTFIKRFMDIMVLPYIQDEHEKMRTQDELPQSSGGKTITTTEPKFIPQEAASIRLKGDIDVKFRLIDCVGFMVDGATGHTEDDMERMVKTPWYDAEVPFTQAAEIGTQKVITDHSTIGIVITTDGSFGELPRENYLAPEEKAIQELKRLQKPFVVLVNTEKPYSEDAQLIAQNIHESYQVPCMTVNCEQLKKEDIHHILETVLYEFPISTIEFYMPKWVEMLPEKHEMKTDIVENIRNAMTTVSSMRDFMENTFALESTYIKKSKIDQIDMADGGIKINLDVDDSFYYTMISDLVGTDVQSEYQLIHILQDMAKLKHEYQKVQNAVEAVHYKGYGVVTPNREEIHLDKPEVIKHGNKYGVKIKAESPSIHMIRANIETEIAPIVGTQEQAEDLIRYISSADTADKGIWETNIFGKTIEQLVNDGISNKISMIGEESQMKLQETMQKIVNDSNGGMVCIII